jgi:hypothetical protein
LVLFDGIIITHGVSESRKCLIGAKNTEMFVSKSLSHLAVMLGR